VARAKADAIDASLYALIGGAYVGVTFLRARGAEDRGAPTSSLQRAKVLSRGARQAAELLGERFGSPGQRIVGLRTVDSRTGEPVALPLSVALALLKLATGPLSGRLAPVASASPQQAHSDLAREIKDLRERHPDDPQARIAALHELYEARAVEPAAPLASFARRQAVSVALGQLNKRLRRRLAPTTVVLGRPDQRP
jgi:hypothetical protein